MTEPQRISYRFDLPDGSQKTLDFTFDATDFRLSNPTPAEPPFWTALQFNQCANCPLGGAEHAHCPAALQMVSALEPLSALVSFDTVGVTVTQAERAIYAETTAQQAMSSVLGLVMATAGCPWTDRFRPMARFHLPFASEVETIYRSVCMFLLARELSDANANANANADVNANADANASASANPGAGAAHAFAALEALYENLHAVNRGMSRRLGAATRTDPARNAMALLDSYTTLLPAALESSLDELKPLFDAWRKP